MRLEIVAVLIFASTETLRFDIFNGWLINVLMVVNPLVVDS